MKQNHCLVCAIFIMAFLGCNKTITVTGNENTAVTANVSEADVTASVAVMKTIQFNSKLSYKTTDYGTGLWKYDSSDNVSKENTGTVIVNNLGQRLKRAYAGAVSAQWFGLKGDGSDETAALQAAINASAGNTLTLPAGTFFTRQIVLVSNITITGKNSKLRMIQGAYDNIMVSLVGLQNVEISGLEIALNGIQGNIWDGTTAIELKNCTNVKIDNCFIHDNTFAAIRLIGGNNQIRVNNNFIENTDVGVHANNTNTNINIVSNTFSKGTSEGITIYGYDNQNYPTNFLIDSNIILNKASFGINIPFAKFGTITHNTISGCYGGVTMHDAVSVGSDNYYTSDMVIKNNAISNATFGIIYVGDRTTVNNNQISNIQQTGISVNNFANTSILTTSTDISSNTITGTGQAGGGASGIALNNLINSTVTGNIISQCGQVTSSIRFNGNCNNISITGNNCGNGMLQSPNTNYSQSIIINNNTLPQTYFPIASPFYYKLNMVVSGNKYTTDTSYNTAPDATGQYTGINSFNVRSQYNLAAGVVTYIEPSWAGRRIILHSTDSFILEQGNNLTLRGGVGSVAIVPRNGNITFNFDGSVWTEVSRTF